MRRDKPADSVAVIRWIEKERVQVNKYLAQNTRKEIAIVFEKESVQITFKNGIRLLLNEHPLYITKNGKHILLCDLFDTE